VSSEAFLELLCPTFLQCLFVVGRILKNLEHKLKQRRQWFGVYECPLGSG
jgi:hypothetical protein